MADAVPDGKAGYLCECGDVHPNSFFVVPGHEKLEVERVVDELGLYLVVEKIVPLDETAIQALTSTDETWVHP
jgi:hypothetical protein